MKRTREKIVGAGLTASEYVRLMNFLEARGQTITEFVLLELGHLLKSDDLKISKRIRQAEKVEKCVSIRVSEVVEKEVKQLAEKHNCSKTEVLLTVLQGAIAS